MELSKEKLIAIISSVLVPVVAGLGVTATICTAKNIQGMPGRLLNFRSKNELNIQDMTGEELGKLSGAMKVVNDAQKGVENAQKAVSEAKNDDDKKTAADALKAAEDALKKAKEDEQKTEEDIRKSIKERKEKK